MTAPLARLSGITKRFGGVTALRGASLELRAGEVHGLLGENGAGKSTLVGVLGGMVRPDHGVMEIGGEACAFRTPREAAGAGVGMVHQHFTLVPALTVLDNLALGNRTPRVALRAEAEGLMGRTGLVVPLDPAVEELGVGDRQRVEILKALLRKPRILVLDEPTAVLAPQEVEALFGLLREVAAAGRGVVMVTHKLAEVLSVADVVTVLREGATVLASPAAETSIPSLVQAMVGGGRADAVALGLGASEGDRRVSAPGPRTALGTDVEVVADLRDAWARGGRGGWAVRGVSLAVRRGEVVGVAGVEGNGQRELALVLAGVREPDEGVSLIAAGVGFIPQDRTREGLVRDFDLAENMALALRRNPEFVRGAFLRWGAVRRRTAELLRRFDVRASGPSARAGALSGGNQQRVVVARELSMASDLLVAENPTRGLDVGAAAFVHEELIRLASTAGGPGIVLISTDLDEVLALAHRVFVMSEGRLVPVPEEGRTREGVGARMLAGAAAQEGRDG